MSLQVELLESSFQAIAPRADELADRFYERLFREHPELRPMFPESEEAMKEQKNKLVAALALVVENLRRPAHLTAAIRALGLRHVDYGVKREHYPVVGLNLLATLADIAGDAWTPQLEGAWADAYNAICAIIFEALDEISQDAA